ncbi:hypothetical protein B0H19DRAFT_1079583 [Mycena capillaripes]|nr:hypothetical protein B0H19DRAFT_1079583 [Mycena capillaripes]
MDTRFPASMESDDEAIDQLDDGPNMGPFNLAVWTAIFLDFIDDPSAAPKELAIRRGIVACICSGWHRRLYSTPILWSTINIAKDMPISALHFAVSRCAGGMDVKLNLQNVRFIAGRHALPADVIDWVDLVFAIIGPTSPRWLSFELDTDHPVVFSRVHFHCAQLDGCSLTSLRLSYTHLPRHWPGVTAEIAGGPRDAGVWFLQETPNISHLSIFCVPMLWDNFDFVHRLQTVDLTDFASPLPLSPALLPSLFSVARQLRSVRLGELVPFSLSSAYTLYSPTLEVLDIDFETGPVVGAIFATMDVPRLTDLTVRNVRTSVNYLLACPSLLLGLHHFCAVSDIGDNISLQHLFNAMPSLRTLDFGHAPSHVFSIYCEWARLRLRFQQPTLVGNLRVLRLPRIDLRLVVVLVGLVIDSGGHVHCIRVERPLVYGDIYDAVVWLRHNISDFRFTNVYSSIVISFFRRDDPIISGSIWLLADLGRTTVFSVLCSLSIHLLGSLIAFGTFSSPDYFQLVEQSSMSSGLQNLEAFCIAEGLILSAVNSSSADDSSLDSPRVQLFPEILEQVLQLVADDDTLDFWDFLQTRGALLGSTRWIAHCLRQYPPFWNRLLISPRSPISVIHDWFDYSRDLPLYLAFRAVQDSGVRPVSLTRSAISFDTFVDQASHALSLYMDRCVTLSISAESPRILDKVLFSLEWTTPAVLQSLRVRFILPDYRRIRPFCVDHFSFITTPPMGLPFPPCNTLSWISDSVVAPSVAYSTSDCIITQPARQPVVWSDVLEVFSSLADVHTLTMDAIVLNYRPEWITCSAPLFSLRSLEFTFRGLLGMAHLISRLNLPSAITLKVIITATQDIQCLCTCSTLLSTVKDIVLVGTCPTGHEFHTIFSLLRSVERIDLRGLTYGRWYLQGDLGVFGSIFVIFPSPLSTPHLVRCLSITHSCMSDALTVDVDIIWANVIGPPPEGFCPINKLPNEMLAECFGHFCRDSSVTPIGSVSFWAYNHARDTIMHTRRGWRQIVLDHPIFWCKLLIDSSTHYKYIERHVSNTGALHVDVHISLSISSMSIDSDNDGALTDDSSSTNYSLPINPLDLLRSSEHAKHCLLAARESVPLWRWVHISTSVDILLLDILQVLGGSPAPKLRSLTFTCPSYTTNRRTCDALFMIPPPLFGAHMPALEELHLISASLPWGESNYFGRLTSLTIKGLPILAQPRASEFIATLVASPTLRDVLFGAGGLLWDRSPVASFTLPSLEVLTIEYKVGTIDVLEILAFGVFPVIQEFNAIDFDHVAWFATLNLSFLSHLARLSITGRVNNTLHVPLLYKVWILDCY